ncbi:hypothetical protein Pcinc_016558 [Petrolisthes cinctipes]|uniref:Uncharacterized protein n=1 Tax=Petrolisthes cinctipes TaxID=88211 RepID=A0AAE1FSD1_PETCI|nr:hypothetical protein Pcinc_016558 [Petrolisthes cinctipes]
MNTRPLVRLRTLPPWPVTCIKEVFRPVVLCSLHPLIWSCKNSSPVDRGKKKEEGRTEEELERQHQGVDEENIRGDRGLGARPRQSLFTFCL